MNIHFYKSFQKKYKRRIKNHPKLVKKFNQRVATFSKNPNDPILKNHQLSGIKKNTYSIAITGDIRALYKIENNEVYFFDIGTHNQVY